MKIIIPARKGSKGVPLKNRKLLNYTLETIPEEYKKDIIISTNDEEIIKEAQNKNINFVQRSEKLSDDYPRS